MMNVSANPYSTDHESTYRNAASCMAAAPPTTEHLHSHHYPSSPQLHEAGNHGASSLLYHHSHLLEYGITTSNSPIMSESYYETSPYSSNNTTTSSYNNSTMPSPDHHIISSDNGLSYTNLDYMYSGTLNPSGYSPYNPDDRLRLPNAQQYDHHLAQCNYPNPQNTSWIQQHHTMTFQNTLSDPNVGLDGSVGPDVKQIMDHGQFMKDSRKLGYAVGGSHQSTQPPPGYSMKPGDVLNEHHSANNVTVPTTQQQQQQQQQSTATHAPTYKWMQVKRNVPKPQSEYLLKL